MEPTITITSATAPLAVQISVPLWLKLTDLFRPKAEIKLEFKGHGYSEKSFPIVYRNEQGVSRSLIIRGKPSFVLAAVQYLTGVASYEANNRTTALIGARDALNAVNISLPFSTILSDFFRFSRNEIALDFKGDDYESKRVFLYKKESGSRFTITARGKPGFCLALIRHFKVNAQAVNGLLANHRLPRYVKR